MGRKNLVKDFVSINAGALSNASLKGVSTVLNQFDILSYIFTWTGGQTTNGDIGIEASLDNITWFPLDFSVTMSLNAVSGNHQLLIKDVAFSYARPFYTRTNGSASGTLTVELFSTNKGA